MFHHTKPKKNITPFQQQTVSSVTPNKLLITDPTTCPADFDLLHCQKVFLDWSMTACCQSSQTPTCQPMLQLWGSTSDKTLPMHQLLFGLASLTEEAWRYLDNKYQTEFSETWRCEKLHRIRPQCFALFRFIYLIRLSFRSQPAYLLFILVPSNNCCQSFRFILAQLAARQSLHLLAEISGSFNVLLKIFSVL